MSSVGIIGGADGPTKVFLAGPVWPVVFVAALAALVVVLLVRKRK